MPKRHSFFRTARLTRPRGALLGLAVLTVETSGAWCFAIIPDTASRCDCGREFTAEELDARSYGVQEHVSGYDVDGSELTRVALLRRPEGGCEGDEER